MRFLLTLFLTIGIVAGSNAEVYSVGTYYVTADWLEELLAPNKTGKVTNRLPKGQKVEVFEVKDGWARTSNYYDGTVEGMTGKVARWVSAEYLSTEQPSKPKVSKSDSKVSKAIEGSDDFGTYEKQFIAASENLIKSNQCTLEDFKEMGGWWTSTSHGSQLVYFTYCGGMKSSNKIYLDVSSGNTFK